MISILINLGFAAVAALYIYKHHTVAKALAAVKAEIAKIELEHPLAGVVMTDAVKAEIIVASALKSSLARLKALL